MIVFKISDGLGNQLFQYAHARVLQTKIKQPIYLDISDINLKELRESDTEKGEFMRLCGIRKYELDDLSITLPVISKDELSKKFNRKSFSCNFLKYCDELKLLQTVFLKETLCKEKSFHFSRWQNYYVEGYFFDKIFYEEESELLMKEFQLKRRLTLPEEIKNVLISRDTVSLHIRRGDFLKVGRDMSKDDYYKRAIMHIKNELPTPFLFVFSDDIEWVQNNMKFDMDHMMISGKGFSDCEELTLMSMCKNNIIANSTFSYWGAWLNSNKKKIVISPRGWRKRIIPDTWVQL